MFININFEIKLYKKIFSDYIHKQIKMSLEQLKNLEKVKGQGTSMISLLIPKGTDI